MKSLLQFAEAVALLAIGTLSVAAAWTAHQVKNQFAVIAVQTAVVAQNASAAEIKIGALADAAKTVLTDSRPRIAASLIRLSDAAANLDEASAHLRDAPAEIVRPCATPVAKSRPGAPILPCGTLADVNRTLGSIRLAAGQVTAVSEREQSQLDQANQQETAIALSAEADMNRLGDAIDGVNALARNRDLTASLKSLNSSLGAVNGIATDTQQAWHKFLHPSWPHRIWSAVSGVGIDVAKFFVP